MVRGRCNRIRHNGTSARALGVAGFAVAVALFAFGLAVPAGASTQSGEPPPYRLLQVNPGGDTSWLDLGDGTRTIVQSPCRNELLAAGLTIEFVPGTEIKALTRIADITDTDCNTLAASIAMVDPPTTGYRMIAKASHANGGSAWFLLGDDTRLWVSGECRATLEGMGIQTTVATGATITSFEKIINPSPYYCVLLRDVVNGDQGGQRIESNAETYRRVDRPGGQAWFAYEGTRFAIDDLCFTAMKAIRMRNTADGDPSGFFTFYPNKGVTPRCWYMIEDAARLNFSDWEPGAPVGI